MLSSIQIPSVVLRLPTATVEATTYLEINLIPLTSVPINCQLYSSTVSYDSELANHSARSLTINRSANSQQASCRSLFVFLQIIFDTSMKTFLISWMMKLKYFCAHDMCLIIGLVKLVRMSLEINCLYSRYIHVLCL